MFSSNTIREQHELGFPVTDFQLGFPWDFPTIKVPFLSHRTNKHPRSGVFWELAFHRSIPISFSAYMTTLGAHPHFFSTLNIQHLWLQSEEKKKQAGMKMTSSIELWLLAVECFCFSFWLKSRNYSFRALQANETSPQLSLQQHTSSCKNSSKSTVPGTCLNMTDTFNQLQLQNYSDPTSSLPPNQGRIWTSRAMRLPEEKGCAHLSSQRRCLR